MPQRDLSHNVNQKEHKDFSLGDNTDPIYVIHITIKSITSSLYFKPETIAKCCWVNLSNISNIGTIFLFTASLLL